MNEHKLPYELHIREENLPFHRDLDEDMMRKKEGMFSFIIKLNDGNIVDYIVLEYDSFTGLEL